MSNEYASSIPLSKQRHRSAGFQGEGRRNYERPVSIRQPRSKNIVTNETQIELNDNPEYHVDQESYDNPDYPVDQESYDNPNYPVDQESYDDYCMKRDNARRALIDELSKEKASKYFQSLDGNLKRKIKEILAPATYQEDYRYRIIDEDSPRWQGDGFGNVIFDHLLQNVRILINREIIKLETGLITKNRTTLLKKMSGLIDAYFSEMGMGENVDYLKSQKNSHQKAVKNTSWNDFLGYDLPAVLERHGGTKKRRRHMKKKRRRNTKKRS